MMQKPNLPASTRLSARDPLRLWLNRVKLDFTRIPMKFWIAFIVLNCAPLWAKLTPEQAAQLPPPAARQVTFASDIKPILESSCIKCHGRGKDKGGFRIDDRAALLKGGDSGPAVLPGQSAESYLIELVSGLNPDAVMPEKGSRLTKEQVGLLRAWIDQGLGWDEGVSFGRVPPANLHPNTVEVPQVAGLDHPVDRLLHNYFQKHSVPSGEIEDRVFARRVYLDAIGLVPTPEEMARFAGDASPDKRRRLVRQVLGRNSDYAQHWLTFWNDALRNDYRGTGYIDGGRKQITSWLFSSLLTNKPYDQFVAELIDPNPESEGFIKGIVWRGVVNASQVPPMQAAQNVSQVFMGVNLKCASCHDSFINDWTLADAYGLASIYADGPLEMFKCDQPTGKTAAMKFIYPELGLVDSSLDRKARLKHLSDVVTSEKNGRLSRTIVNRLWARLFGRGLVEPVDEMDQLAWHAPLLDWLAQDLVEHGYDLKHTLELLMSSRAYALPAMATPERAEKEFVFRGPLLRRMGAEQFLDVLSQVTRVWNGQPAVQLDFGDGIPATFKADFANAPAQPKWIWKEARAGQSTDPGTVYFRKFIDLPEAPVEASLIISCDNGFTVFINGQEAGSAKDHTKPTIVQAKKLLRKGINLIAIEARNWPGNPGQPEADQGNPAGLVVYGFARAGDKVMDFATDATWLWSVLREDDWQRPNFAAAGWLRAGIIGGADASPWKLGKTLAKAADQAGSSGRTRAALTVADPLMTALGRPNREQVITTRSSVATTLQALELTNGPTLAAKLKEGAAQLADEFPDQDRLVRELWTRGLGRPPTDAEKRSALELLGQGSPREGIEDLLWAMAMLPEFQLIY